MTDCKHNHLDRLEGPIHPSGKDYVCKDCGEQLRAEVSVPTVQFGTGAAAQPGSGTAGFDEAKWLGLIEAVARDAVILAFIRGDLSCADGPFLTAGEVADDAAKAILGEETCADEPVKSATQLLAEIRFAARAGQSDALRSTLLACKAWNMAHGNWSQEMEDLVERALASSATTDSCAPSQATRPEGEAERQPDSLISPSAQEKVLAVTFSNSTDPQDLALSEQCCDSCGIAFFFLEAKDGDCSTQEPTFCPGCGGPRKTLGDLTPAEEGGKPR